MELNATHNLKLKIQSGQIVFGTEIWHGNDPRKTPGALKEIGYDFIWLELEHALLDKETIFEYIRASKEVGIPVVIRPEENYAYFRPYLDAGVNGLVLPLIKSTEEVQSAINRAYFPPIGHRGVGIGISSYLVDDQDFTEIPYLTITEYINNNTVIFPMIERVDGVRYLPQILRLEGVTTAMVGHFDLTCDIGVIDPKIPTPEIMHNEHTVEKIRQIAKICKDAGKAAGIAGVFSGKDAAQYAKEGYTLFVMGGFADGKIDDVKSLIEEAKSLIS